jgi:hypothetical protein
MSVYPTSQFATWFADILNNDMYEPVKESNNGWVWLVGFLLVGLINFFLCYVLVLYLFCKINKWNLKQAKTYILKSEVSEHLQQENSKDAREETNNIQIWYHSPIPYLSIFLAIALVWHF